MVSRTPRPLIRLATLNRHLSNGEQIRNVAALALKRSPSVDFGGYWQRHIKTV